MANIGPFSFPSKGFDAAIFDCDGTLVDSMPVHFEAWCDALTLYGAGGVFKEDVFFAMGGRPTMDIVVELNDEYDLRLDPAAVALAKREFFLKRLDLVTLIEEVVTADDVVNGKPAPDIFLKAAELLGVAPSKCLALEDAPAGIIAAQNAGMQVIAIPCPLASFG